MQYAILLTTSLLVAQPAPDALGPGNCKHSITVDGRKREHWIHVPTKYDAKKPTPVVVALHGATMVHKLMEMYTGLDKTADDNNFIVVYPNGELLTWNAGLFPGDLNKTDDVKYLNKVLDDVEGCLNVDRKRVYFTGMSNGGMMCYRVAAEMSERVAAIAPVGGTMSVKKYEPKRPVPVVHFHGTKDTLVPFDGPLKFTATPGLLSFRSVKDTLDVCIKTNGCDEKGKESAVDVNEKLMKVMCTEFLCPKKKADVVLYTIENGGHTWPGSPFAASWMGPATRNFSANAIMWEFFKSHPLR
ncbi:MAG TPA: dienelactone hydrolase family protein [Gemmataceae bacterium]|nr:dienelactone hydrolase family protein [Gemmataceae bacterium]